jgi:translation initiation factor 2 beta subunit (eIF-2beta)/eIF-5
MSMTLNMAEGRTIQQRISATILSHAKCPRCNSNDKEAIAYVGDNYNLRCKRCWYERTESWHPSMEKEDKASPCNGSR